MGEEEEEIRIEERFESPEKPADFKGILFNQLQAINYFSNQGELEKYEAAVNTLERNLKGYLVDEKDKYARKYRKLLSKAYGRYKDKTEVPKKFYWDFDAAEYEKRCRWEFINAKHSLLMAFLLEKGFLMRDIIG